MTEGQQLSLPLDRGSGGTLVSAYLKERPQRQATGRVQVTRCFEEKGRVRTPFGQERTITTKTVPLNLTMNTAWRKVWVVLSFIVLPGERNLHILGPENPVRGAIGRRHGGLEVNSHELPWR